MKKIYTIVLCTILIINISKGQARFEGLGDLPGGIFESYAYSLSSDGKIIVGVSQGDSSEEAVKWIYNSATKKYEMFQLGRMPGQYDAVARGVSDDGKFAVGYVETSQGTFSVKWTSGGSPSYFVPQPEGSYIKNLAYGISGDGLTIVGEVMGDSGRMKPFKYTGSGGVQILDLPNYFPTGLARAVSKDGSMIVGYILSNDPAIHDNWQAAAWGPSGYRELARGNQTATANGISKNGKIAVGNLTQDATANAMRWATDGGSAGYLPYPVQVPWGVSGDGSVIVGWTYYDGYFGGNKAFVWDASHGMRIIQDILEKDFKINLGGWKLTNATGVSADGTVISGIGINPDGKTEGWCASIPYINFNGPYEGQTLIAEEVDSLKWEYGGLDINSFNILLSLDSGKTKTPVIQNYPAVKKAFAWNIPDTLARYCKLYVVNVTDTSVKAESKIFIIRAPRLHRTKPLSDDWELFDPQIHGWAFQQTAAALWPNAWWFQFNYQTGVDPFTKAPYPPEEPFLSAKSKNFIDWPLLVNTFGGESNCYWVLPVIGNTGSYDARAGNFWKVNKDTSWEGSCYGMTYSTLMAFDNPERFKTAYPDMPDYNDPKYSQGYILSKFVPTDQIRKVVNALFFSQYGKEQDQYFKAQLASVKPKQLLSDLRDNLTNSYPWFARGLSLIPDNGLGGHEVLPYRISKNPGNASQFRIYVNDSNAPGSYDTYIIVDTSANTWTYDRLKNSSGDSWTGRKGLTLDLETQRYYSHPLLNKQVSRQDVNNPFMAAEGNYDFYVSHTSSVLIKDAQGRRIGNTDTNLVMEIPGASPVRPPSNHSTPPGYTVPKGQYTISNINLPDTAAYFNVVSDSMIYSCLRTGAAPGETDNFAFGFGGMRIINNDAKTKQYSLSALMPLPGSYSLERQADFESLSLQKGDSIAMSVQELSDVVLRNFGTHQVTYNVKLRNLIYKYQVFDKQMFDHKTITLNRNTTHKIHPNWSSMNGKTVDILIDNGNNGSYDSTYVVDNQFTGLKDKSLIEAPGSYYLSQNYPNPFNNSTVINYSIPKEGLVKLKIYNLLGQEVASLVDESKQAGSYRVTFNTQKLSSGVYLYRLTSGTFTETKKMILMK